MDAFERMPESFIDWLMECPVPWMRIKINENTVHYSFDAPDEEDEESEEEEHEHCKGCDCVLRWDESEDLCRSCEDIEI